MQTIITPPAPAATPARLTWDEVRTTLQADGWEVIPAPVPAPAPATPEKVLGALTSAGIKRVLIGKFSPDGMFYFEEITLL